MKAKQLSQMLEMVKEFYIRMEDEEYLFTGKYKDENRKKLRQNIFDEELKEWVDVNFSTQFSTDKIIGELDAVVDMFYVAIGNLIENSRNEAHAIFKIRLCSQAELLIADTYRKRSGFSSELVMRAFEEVHASNMSKRLENEKIIRREDGKILKGPHYFPPNLAKILKIQEEEL